MPPMYDRLPLHTPDEITLARIVRLHELREQKRKIETEEAEIKAALDDLPDGVRVNHLNLPRSFHRTRPIVRSRLLDLTVVPSHFLKPTLIQGTVGEHFRKTGEEPAGIRVSVCRGTLAFSDLRE